MDFAGLKLIAIIWGPSGLTATSIAWIILPVNYIEAINLENAMTFNNFIDNYIEQHGCYDPELAWVEARQYGFSHQEVLDILDFLYEFYTGGPVLD